MLKGLNPNLAINKLNDNCVVLDILTRWGKSAKWKFFVKEDAVDKRPKGHNSNVDHQEPLISEAITDSLLKSNIHKAPILICASEKNTSI